MRNEPKSELSRYAFGFSDKKPGRLFWIIHLGMIAFIIWSYWSEAHASCRHYTHWGYPWPQPRCVERLVQYTPPPAPPLRPEDAPSWLLMPDVDIPLPSLEGMEFPPDCDADWCARMKGIGMLRDRFGTN